MRLNRALFETINRGVEAEAYPNRVAVILATLIAGFLPRRFWYGGALRATWFTTRYLFLKRTGAGPIRWWRAHHLNRLLSLLTRVGVDFPVPSRNVGLESLGPLKGVALCTVHLPLAKVAVRSLLEHGVPIDATIVGRATGDGRFAAWGLSGKLETLVVDLTVLARAMSILVNPGNVFLMIDSSYLSHEYSPNIMRACGRVGSKAVFFYSTLNEDLEIVNTFLPLPHPNCESKAAIAENIAFIRQAVESVRLDYAVHPGGGAHPNV